MKKQDWFLIIGVAGVLALFGFSQTGCYAWFERSTANHPFIMAFFKFALLATLGEMLALRIRKGNYTEPGFGVLPRMIVWGFLGIAIAMAMMIFKVGTPFFLSKLLSCDYNTLMNTFSAETLTWGKVGIAFCVSVAMNCIFAPVMMTLHKCTDIHISQTGGTVAGLFKPMSMKKILSSINWEAQWGVVFKKTIPLFWFPAHTITFILPPDLQVLFAAMLGVALGLILALAAK